MGSKHSSLEHLSRNFGFWNGLPYLIQPQKAATMCVSSMSDLDNEAVPKKTSFGDAASKMGGGNINSVAMITKSLVKMGSVSEADMPAAWDSIATDLELSIDSEYATGNGELLVEYTTGVRVRMGQKNENGRCEKCAVKNQVFILGFSWQL